MSYDTEYVFADIDDIRRNTFTDFDIYNYIYVYEKEPYKIRVTLKADAPYVIDRDIIWKIIAKKYDELMLNEYVTVEIEDRRKEG